MLYRRTNLKNKIKHLEKAMFENRIASSNDCTGFMNTPPQTEEKADNMSDMLNVPTSSPEE